jgi:hypothetical protein
VLDFIRAVQAAGYHGPLSLEIFNDQFRGGSARLISNDGRRSLVHLRDQVARPRSPCPTTGSWSAWAKHACTTGHRHLSPIRASASSFWAATSILDPRLPRRRPRKREGRAPHHIDGGNKSSILDIWMRI